jgi:hypothetical protein
VWNPEPACLHINPSPSFYHLYDFEQVQDFSFFVYKRKMMKMIMVVVVVVMVSH